MLAGIAMRVGFMLKIGVLAFQGDVIEHMLALKKAGESQNMHVEIIEVRNARDLEGLAGLIIPGGESTTMSMLLEREAMLEKMKKIPAIFGTCAGLILMAKEVGGAMEGQKSLELMDVSVERNAYGSQLDSFESKLECELVGDTKIIFIRAPKITKIGKNAKVIGRIASNGEPVIILQKEKDKFYLGATCHPELTTPKVHEYFLKEAQKLEKD